MKKALLVISQALLALAIMYPLFYFTFYAWNPADWSEIGRFAYAVMSITLFLAIALLSEKQVEEMAEIEKELKKVVEVMKNFNEKQKTSKKETVGS